MKPPCTCPRDDSGNTNGCELHDPRSDWNQATEFYTAAIPCEACGQPCTKRRYDPEYELWIGVDCPACNQPDEPICRTLAALIMEADTVGQVVAICKQHRLTCPACGEPQPARIMPMVERYRSRRAA